MQQESKTQNYSFTTVGEIIQWGTERFDQSVLFFCHGTDNAWDEALTLVLHVLGLSWDVDSSVLEQMLSEEQQAEIRCLFERRINEQIPAAYLTGEAWFAGYRF